jgi:hypothetical protein
MAYERALSIWLASRTRTRILHREPRYVQLWKARKDRTAVARLRLTIFSPVPFCVIIDGFDKKGRDDRHQKLCNGRPRRAQERETRSSLTADTPTVSSHQAGACKAPLLIVCWKACRPSGWGLLKRSQIRKRLPPPARFPSRPKTPPSVDVSSTLPPFAPLVGSQQFLDTPECGSSPNSRLSPAALSASTFSLPLFPPPLSLLPLGSIHCFYSQPLLHPPRHNTTSTLHPLPSLSTWPKEKPFASPTTTRRSSQRRLSDDGSDFEARSSSTSSPPLPPWVSPFPFASGAKACLALSFPWLTRVPLSSSFPFPPSFASL